MKAQFKSLQAAHVNNVAAQSSVQQLQQTTAQPTIDNCQNADANLHTNLIPIYAVELQKKQTEIDKLKQEKAALLTLTQHDSQKLKSEIQTIHQEKESVLKRSNQINEEVITLNRTVNSLRFSIKVLSQQKDKLEKSQEQNERNLKKVLEINSRLMQIIQYKDKEIESLKNEAPIDKFINSEISSIDAVEQDSLKHASEVQQNNLHNLHSVNTESGQDDFQSFTEVQQNNSQIIQPGESFLIESSNPNISQQQIDVSYGEPILNQHGQPILGGAQPQLMGDSSQDFSIIDHQD